MISKIISLSSNKSLKPSGKEKGIIVSSRKGEIVVKLTDSTINLTVEKNDLKVGDEVAVSFSKDTVNLQKVITKLPSPKDFIKVESSEVIRKVLSQIDQVKNIENEDLQKTLSNLSDSIKNRELHISILKKSIEVLEKENESFRHNNGINNKDIEKLISTLRPLKNTMPELTKSGHFIQDSNVKISVEGDYKPQIIFKNSIDDVKIFIEKLGVSQDSLKSISPKSESFIISVTPTANSTNAIIDIYTEKDQNQGVIELQKTFFQSPQLKDLSPEILLNLLKDIENIKPDTLVKIDEFFKVAIDKGNQTHIKDGVMKLLLPQLVSIFNIEELDIEHLKQTLTPLVNDKLSQQIVEISKDKDIQKLNPQIENVLKDIKSVITNENKKNIIPVLFKLTGLSNENDILKLIEGVKSDVELPKEKGDIKDILSNIIKVINTEKDSNVAGNNNEEILIPDKKRDQTIIKPELNLLKALNIEISKYSEVKLQVAQIVEKIELFLNQMANVSESSSEVMKINNLYNSHDLLNLIDQLKEIPEFQSKNVQETLSNLVKNIMMDEHNIALVEKSIKALEKANENIKTSTGHENKELIKLISMLTFLKDTLPEISKHDHDPTLKNDIVKIVVKGDFKAQVIQMDKFEDVKSLFNKLEIPQDQLKDMSSKSGPFIISITPQTELKESTIGVYPQKNVEENIINIQKPLILSSQFKNANSDLLLHLLKNNKNPNIISDIFNLINQLKNLKTSNNEDLPKTLINFAKSIASGQPSLSLLNDSITLLEKESGLIKLNGGAENKEISKLTDILSSVKKLLPTPKNIDLEIQENRIKFNVEGKFKSHLIFIDKMEDVKTFLDKMKIPQDLMNKIPAKNGPFMVSVTPDKEQNNGVINIYLEKNYINGIKNLQRTHFQSSQLKNSSPDHLLELFKNVESINPESLTHLDDILKTTGMSDSKKSLSDEIMKLIYPQFNNNEIDDNILEQKILPLMDNDFSEKLINMTKSNDIKKLDSNIEKVLKDLLPLITNENKKSLIPVLFKLTELTNENEFLKLINKNEITPRLLNERSNIKSVLQKMLQVITKAEKDGAINNNVQLSNEHKSDFNEQITKFSAIKNQLFQIIEKIEAFQVLAKSVPTSSGESQLITLPINYGGEWVDLQLRVSHKNRETSQKKDKERVTVELNIELSAIGEVSAEMEYFKNKEIAINVTLDNKKIVQWFQNQKVDIEKALRKLDLNIVKLNFRSSKGFLKTREITSKHINSNFDIIG